MKSVERLENGVKTMMLKTEDGKRQFTEVEKKLLPLQDAVMEAQEVELIDINNAKILL